MKNKKKKKEMKEEVDEYNVVEFSQTILLS